jgi:predicted aspartyl protease
MKNSQCSKFAVRAAVFYFTLAWLCQSVHAQPQIPFRLVHDTVILISVMANEQGPFEFVLDTGTNSTVVDPLLARELSLVPLDRIQLDNLAGSQTVVRTSMHSLSTGSTRLENVEVLVRDLSEMRKVDPHIRGMLGQNFMSHFNYLLDYHKHLITIEATHEIRDVMEGSPVSIERSDNKMLVASEAQSPERVRLRLLLDSGANLVVLIPKTSQALELSRQQNWLGATSSGQVGMSVGRLRALTIGPLQFHDIPVAFSSPEPKESERIEDGLLPTALFSTLYVNNQEGWLIFNPRKKKN